MALVGPNFCLLNSLFQLARWLLISIELIYLHIIDFDKVLDLAITLNKENNDN